MLRNHLGRLRRLLFRGPLFPAFQGIGGKKKRPVVPILKPAVPLVVLLFLAVVITQSPTNQWIGTVFAHGGSAPAVALTFDDGPSQYTTQVLDILARYRIHATFFLIGKNVDAHPEIARRIVQEGHVIGNHTFSHPLSSVVKTPAQLGVELDHAEQSIDKVTKARTTLFRPPHGWRSPWMMLECRKKGYAVITWNVDPDDWEHPSATTIVQRVVQKVRPGSIVVMHDGLECKKDPKMQQTVDALPAIIEDLAHKGYAFVTIPDLIAPQERLVPLARSEIPASASPRSLALAQ